MTARIVETGITEPVYDLVNVGDERQFVANGLSVSNCWDFRRHRRSSIVTSINNGKAVLLTEDIWKMYVRDEEDEVDLNEPVMTATRQG